MGFQRLDPQDIITSIDSVTAAAWSNSTPTLTTFFTSSTQEASTTGNYYLDVYQTASTDTSAAIQFSIAYADLDGSGSNFYNTLITGSSPTRTLYGQYRNLVLGNEYASFVFGNVTSSCFWALSIERSRYKEHLLPGTMTLLISGSLGTVSLTDDSKYTSITNYVDAGRVYNLISGSAGNRTSSPKDVSGNGFGWTIASGSYGWFLPDVGLILLNGLAMSGSTFALNGSPSVPLSRSFNAPGLNNRSMFKALSGSKSWLLNSQETLASDYAFVRARSGEFNYTENPSYISSSTGEIVYSTFINNPVTYITTVGLYNDNNELLAVAKLSRPLQKDSTKELLIRTKLDF